MRRLIDWVALAIVLLVFSVMVVARVSDLKPFPSDLSVWTVVTGLSGILGTLAASIAVIVAVADRVGRERPRLVLQRANFELKGREIEMGPPLVNIGGGPAIGILVHVDVPLIEFRIPRPEAVFTPDASLNWSFRVDAIAQNAGAGSRMIPSKLTWWAGRWLSDYFENLANNEDDRMRKMIIRRSAGSKTVTAMMRDVRVGLNYTDRGGIFGGHEQFAAWIQIDLRVEFTDGEWSVKSASGTVGPLENTQMHFDVNVTERSPSVGSVDTLSRSGLLTSTSLPTSPP